MAQGAGTPKSVSDDGWTYLPIKQEKTSPAGAMNRVQPRIVPGVATLLGNPHAVQPMHAASDAVRALDDLFGHVDSDGLDQGSVRASAVLAPDSQPAPSQKVDLRTQLQAMGAALSREASRATIKQEPPFCAGKTTSRTARVEKLQTRRKPTSQTLAVPPASSAWGFGDKKRQPAATPRPAAGFGAQSFGPPPTQAAFGAQPFGLPPTQAAFGAQSFGLPPNSSAPGVARGGLQAPAGFGAQPFGFPPNSSAPGVARGGARAPAAFGAQPFGLPPNSSVPGVARGGLGAPAGFGAQPFGFPPNSSVPGVARGGLQAPAVFGAQPFGFPPNSSAPGVAPAAFGAQSFGLPPNSSVPGVARGGLRAQAAFGAQPFGLPPNSSVQGVARGGQLYDQKGLDLALKQRMQSVVDESIKLKQREESALPQEQNLRVSLELFVALYNELLINIFSFQNSYLPQNDENNSKLILNRYCYALSISAKESVLGQKAFQRRDGYLATMKKIEMAMEKLHLIQSFQTKLLSPDDPFQSILEFETNGFNLFPQVFRGQFSPVAYLQAIQASQQRPPAHPPSRSSAL